MMMQQLYNDGIAHINTFLTQRHCDWLHAAQSCRRWYEAAAAAAAATTVSGHGRRGIILRPKWSEYNNSSSSSSSSSPSITSITTAIHARSLEIMQSLSSSSLAHHCRSIESEFDDKDDDGDCDTVECRPHAHRPLFYVATTTQLIRLLQQTPTLESIAIELIDEEGIPQQEREKLIVTTSGKKFTTTTTAAAAAVAASTSMSKLRHLTIMSNSYPAVTRLFTHMVEVGVVSTLESLRIYCGTLAHMDLTPLLGFTSLSHLEMSEEYHTLDKDSKVDEEAMVQLLLLTEKFSHHLTSLRYAVSLSEYSSLWRCLLAHHDWSKVNLSQMHSISAGGDIHYKYPQEGLKGQLERLIHSFPHLTKIVQSLIWDNEISVLAKAATDLKSLSVRCFTGEHSWEEGWEERCIMTFMSSLIQLHALTHLNIGYIPLNSDQITQVFTASPDLTSFSFTHSQSRGTRDVLNALIQARNVLDRLVSLEMRGDMNRVTYQQLIDQPSLTPCLRRLILHQISFGRSKQLKSFILIQNDFQYLDVMPQLNVITIYHLDHIAITKDVLKTTWNRSSPIVPLRSGIIIPPIPMRWQNAWEKLSQADRLIIQRDKGKGAKAKVVTPNMIPPQPRLVGIELNPGPTASVNLNSLFNDGVHSIFAFLTDREWNCMIVTSKRYYSIAQTSEPCRKKHISTRSWEKSFASMFASPLRRHIVHIQLIDLSQSTQHQLVLSSPDSQHHILFKCLSSLPSLTSIASDWKQLEAAVPVDPASESDSPIKAIVVALPLGPRLTRLDIRSYDAHSGSLSSLLPYFSQLTHLSISISDKHTRAGEPLDAIKRLPHLKRLEFVDIKYYRQKDLEKPIRQTLADLLRFTKEFQHLDYLIYKVTSPLMDPVRQLSEWQQVYLPQMRRIDIQYVKNPNSLMELYRAMPGLTLLNLRSLLESDFHHLAQFTQLESLSIERVMTSPTQSELCERMQASETVIKTLAQCCSLTHLSLGYVYIDDSDCWSRIFSSLPQLTSVSIHSDKRPPSRNLLTPLTLASTTTTFTGTDSNATSSIHSESISVASRLLCFELWSYILPDPSSSSSFHSFLLAASSLRKLTFHDVYVASSTTVTSSYASQESVQRLKQQLAATNILPCLESLTLVIFTLMEWTRFGEIRPDSDLRHEQCKQCQLSTAVKCFGITSQVENEVQRRNFCACEFVSKK